MTPHPIRRASRARSFGHALSGISFAARHEPNMRFHLAAALAAASAGTWLRLGAEEWRWLILAIALVLVAETFNTAVEQACNAVTIRYSPAIKAAKDTAAGAVLLCALSAALIGGTVFLPHLTSPAVMPICQGAR